MTLLQKGKGNPFTCLPHSPQYHKILKLKKAASTCECLFHPLTLILILFSILPGFSEVLCSILNINEAFLYVILCFSPSELATTSKAAFAMPLLQHAGRL